MPSTLAGYQEIVVLAEAACAHVQAERWDELAVTQEELGRHLAALRGQHKPEAESALVRARTLTDQVAGVLAVRRTALLSDLAGLRTTRDGAAGYRPASLGVDRPSVDQAA